jgi:hypothetical protein
MEIISRSATLTERGLNFPVGRRHLRPSGIGGSAFFRRRFSKARPLSGAATSEAGIANISWEGFALLVLALSSLIAVIVAFNL